MASRSNVTIGFGPTGPSIPNSDYFDDFREGGDTMKFSTTADDTAWLNSTDNSGTVKVISYEDGAVRLLPGTSAADYVSIQKCGAAGADYAVRGNRDIYFSTRVRTNDADDIKFFIGLATIDAGTSATAGPVLDGATNSIGFRNALGNVAAFLSVTEDDTTETTNTCSSLADDAWITLAFIVRGDDQVEFYVNDVLTATHAANLPDAGDALAVTFEVSSPTGTTATYLDIDYVYCGVTGNRAS
jgi:hypothetical protein